MIPRYRAGQPLRFIRELQDDPIGMFLRMQSSHVDICEVKVAHLRGVFVFDPDAVERVLVSNHKNYRKKESRSYGPLQAFLGEGLVTSEGDLHLRQRRMIQPSFHKDRVAGFFEVMRRHAEQLVAQWAAPAGAGAEVAVNPRIAEMTLAIIGETMFSADLRDDAMEIAGAVRAVASRFHWASTTLMPLAELWPTEKNRAAREAKRYLDTRVEEIITRRRALPPGDDLLGLLLEATETEKTTAALTRDEVLSMLVAGHETTAIALGWTLWLLSTHPEVREKLEAELEAVLGDAPITLELTRSLPYTTRTIQEVLRLYPAVWALAREAAEPDTLCGRPIPAGTHVFFSPFAIHRHPRYWDDPEAFDPDRFLPERSVGRPKYAYFPFSGGQRKCIGDQFTMLELVTVLATVLRAYRFEVKPGLEVVPAPNVTLPMRDSLTMRVTARSPATLPPGDVAGRVPVPVPAPPVRRGFTTGMALGGWSLLVAAGFAVGSGWIGPGAHLLIASFALVVLMVVAHDAIHSAAHRSYRVNQLVGWVAAAACGVPFSMLVDNHLRHHRAVGTEQDPERFCLGPIWQLPVRWPAMLGFYYLDTWNRLPPRSRLQAAVYLAALTLAVAAFPALLTVWVPPLLIATSLFACFTIWLPHGPLGQRVMAHLPLVTGYHDDHHARPAYPAHQYRALHRWHTSQGTVTRKRRTTASASGDRARLEHAGSERTALEQ